MTSSCRIVCVWPTSRPLACEREFVGTERLFAFQDDVYVCCGTVHTSLEREMWDHAKIQLHQDKTQLWNREGVVPQGWETLTAAARELDPSAVVWKGDPSLPPSEQGVKILGILSGIQSTWITNSSGSVLLTGSCWSRSLLSRIRKLLGRCFSIAQAPGQTDGGIWCEPHCFFEGMSDTDLGCGHPPLSHGKWQTSRCRLEGWACGQHPG